MRRRFRSSLNPINSRKNIVDSTLLAVGAATVSAVNLVTAVDDFTGAAATVPTGATVKSVYLFVQILPTAGTANVDWYIWKNPAGALTPAVPGVVGGNPMRRYVMHEEKGIPGNAADGAYPLTFKGVIKIPRGRQRFGEGDVLQIRLRGADIYNACVKCIYKFYQ